jgi:YbgC/YbaW family acyl-CoA thioester hydrolase
MLSASQTITIRFADADPAGVVFYPRALALAHAAVEDLVRHSPLGWDAWFASPRHAAPLRRAEADFFLPMKPGQSFEVRAAVEQVGTSSMTFLVEFLDNSGNIAARIRTLHVFLDKATGRPLPLTGEIRAAFGAPAPD